MIARNWPEYCPLPRDASAGILWEDLLKDASLMPERATPQAFLRTIGERRMLPEPVAVTTEPKPYIRPEQPATAAVMRRKRRPKPWVLLLAAKRRRRG